MGRYGELRNSRSLESSRGVGWGYTRQTARTETLSLETAPARPRTTTHAPSGPIPLLLTANRSAASQGRIQVWRPAEGFGIRLDGGNAYPGARVLAHYDSMLMKVTASALSFNQAADKLTRALLETRIRGVSLSRPAASPPLPPLRPFLLPQAPGRMGRCYHTTHRAEPTLDSIPWRYGTRRRQDQHPVHPQRAQAPRLRLGACHDFVHRRQPAAPRLHRRARPRPEAILREQLTESQSSTLRDANQSFRLLNYLGALELPRRRAALRRLRPRSRLTPLPPRPRRPRRQRPHRRRRVWPCDAARHASDRGVAYYLAASRPQAGAD